MDDDYVCSAANRTFNLDRPLLFRSGPLINRVHSNSPRFGHTSDIMNLIVGSKEEGKDYAKGVLAGAIALFCFFSAWMIVLMVFKCLGYKRVGFFSGQNVRRPKPPPLPLPQPPLFHDKDNEMEDVAEDLLPRSEVGDNPQADDSSSKAFTETFSTADTQVVANLSSNGTKNTVEKALSTTTSPSPEEYEEQLLGWKKQVKLRERRLRNIRIVALLAGLCIIICVLIMIVEGVRSLEYALDKSRKGLREGQRLAQDAIDLIDNYIVAQNDTLIAAQSFVDEVNGICPSLYNELCTNLGSVDQTCNFTGIHEEFVEVIEPVLATVKNTVYSELRDMQEDLQEIIDIISDADETAGSFQWAFIVAGVFAGILGLLDLFMMWGIVLAWRNKKSSEGCIGCARRCLRGFLLIPAFVLCVFFCWVFGMVFVIGSTASADFCYITPDTRVTAFLYENENKFSGSIVYDFALFYTSACSPEKVPLDMNNKIEKILSVIADLESFLATFSTSSAEFQEDCGTETTAINAVAVILQRQLCLLANSLFDIQDYFSCSNWHPLYSVVMHQSVCTEGFEGFHFVAVSQFCIVLFAMIMLTVRVAFYEIVDKEDAERERLSWVNKWRKCSTCHCCTCDTQQQNEASLVGNDVVRCEEVIMRDK